MRQNELNDAEQAYYEEREALREYSVDDLLKFLNVTRDSKTGVARLFKLRRNLKEFYELKNYDKLKCNDNLRTALY